MPAPDGREWANTDFVADKIIGCILDAFPQIVALSISNELRQAIYDCYVAHIGFGDERKISRLNEMLKDAVGAGTYGPLSRGGSELTDLGRVFQDWHDIYTQAFLDQFDEEGNPL